MSRSSLLSSAANGIQPQQALAERMRGDYTDLAAGVGAQDPETWRRKTCRACGAGGLVDILNLGDMPPANSLLKPEQLKQNEAHFPLTLARVAGWCSSRMWCRRNYFTGLIYSSPPAAG
jgi:hypothetical protein